MIFVRLHCYKLLGCMQYEGDLHYGSVAGHGEAAPAQL